MNKNRGNVLKNTKLRADIHDRIIIFRIGQESRVFMSKVLVTGGAGFIGSHISNRLTGLGYDVIAADNLITGSSTNLIDKVKLYEIDITGGYLKELFEEERPDYVIHEAAQIDINKSMREPVFDAETNIIGTLNVLECCRSTGVKKIIYASSAAVYGHPEYLGIDENHSIKPVSFYGVSKYLSEEYIRFYEKIYGLKYTILRYANVYGGKQNSKGENGVISIFIESMLKGRESVIYGNGKQLRDFIYVEDVAEANICALEKGDNEILNIGTGVGTSINALFKALNDIVGGSRIFAEARKDDILNSYYNVEKGSRILGWKSEHTLDEGLKKTIDYYKNVIPY